MPKKTIKSAQPPVRDNPGEKAKKAKKGRSGKKARRPRSQERGREDMSRRLRSMVWFGAVDNRYTGNSTNAMDVDLLGLADTSGRVMWRIKRHASDPGEERSKLLKGRSAVGVVGEVPGYHHTKGIYASELFTEVLAPHPLKASRRDELIAIVLARLGLYEPTESDRAIARTSKISIVGFRNPVGHDLKAWLMVFARKRHIDRVLLLCLLYLRALARSNLEEAILFRDSIYFAIHRFCTRPGFGGNVHTLWRFITWRRIFSGSVSLEHGEAALAVADRLVPEYFRRFSTPTGRRQYEWARYIAACGLEMQDCAPATHITKRTPDIDAFLLERSELEVRAQRSWLAEALWRMRRNMREGITASTRFQEMRGHREPWRPGDY